MIFDELFDAVAGLFEELLVGIAAAIVGALNVGWRWLLRGLYVFVALGGLYVLAALERSVGAGLLGVGILCLAIDVWFVVRG
ncbi:hypothetical protein AUR64_16985 [Haloprofundus marisrubri]|uniref:Uncharacterized protein n=1 Tax=Haloprofundus marisrubri TaxID=1514971 RepID=A0A0W1R7R5_9EURY|nr:hypothetical protein [Haloprofundus marisrubri]KTG09470.1 hypothetical protein AUR64_16985 [Haloprofundus marisrubri]